MQSPTVTSNIAKIVQLLPSRSWRMVWVFSKFSSAFANPSTNPQHFNWLNKNHRVHLCSTQPKCFISSLHSHSLLQPSTPRRCGKGWLTAFKIDYRSQHKNIDGGCLSTRAKAEWVDAVTRFKGGLSQKNVVNIILDCGFAGRWSLNTTRILTTTEL